MANSVSPEKTEMFKKKSRIHYIRLILKTGSLKKVPMKLLKWGKKMPSTKKYFPMPNDVNDTRIPLHAEEAFEYGISFQAKYIGTMDVPRPTSRVEIVAAMRRIRYEFKANGAKKRLVTMDISIDGVRVSTQINSGLGGRRPKFFCRKKQDAPDSIELMHHPIYRIFYVSHDSADLKIFSYIVREGASNIFKCNVFKSTKKCQAMKIVRTVGQAFEVCHKLQGNDVNEPEPSTSSAPDNVVTIEHVGGSSASKEPASDCDASDTGGASTSKAADQPKRSQYRPANSGLPPPAKKEGKRTIQSAKPVPNINLPDLPECVTKVETSSVPEGKAKTPLTAQHQVQLLRERLNQQTQQTRAAVAQIMLLRDQLAVEQTARCEAQARTHQLLVHNKELLDHIAALVAQLQEKEKGNARPISAQQLTLLPQMKAGSNEATKNENVTTLNGNSQPLHSDDLIDFDTQKNEMRQNIENNNVNLSKCNISASAPKKPNDSSSSPNFDDMTSDEAEDYLILKFQEIALSKDKEIKLNNNKYFYQNRRGFPHIPPLNNDYSSSDLAKLLKQHGIVEKSSEELEAKTKGHSYNTSQDSRSNDSGSSSSDDEIPYIMPLSHNGTFKATCNDGRVKLIVPISPSESTAHVEEPKEEPKPSTSGTSGATLNVPGAESLAPGAPITRSTSEKVPNHSEMMTALRSQWTRHTTK